MALLASEIVRIKAELGYNVLSISAEPYVGITQIFDQVVLPYTLAGAATTCTTSVSASTEPTPRTLTLASGTGFSAGDRIVVDVDSRQEIGTAISVSGAALVVPLSRAHTGTYPVTVEGGESIVRELLANIRATKTAMASAQGEGMLRKVDEVEFYGSSSQTQFGALGRQLRFWRDELAAVLGVVNGWSARGGGSGGAISLY